MNKCICGCDQLIPYGKCYRPSTYARQRYIRGHNAKGSTHPCWKGGKKQSKYIRIKMPDHHSAPVDGYIPEHRVVYEEYHKCCLLPWVVIHHKNEITTDNRPENLTPYTIAQHGIHHMQNVPKCDFSDRSCSMCGSNTTYMKRNESGLLTPDWAKGDNGTWLCKHCKCKIYYLMRRKASLIR